MSPPGNVDGRRPHGTGPTTNTQQTTTTAVPDSVTAQPTITGLDRAIANASSWDAANFRAAVVDWAKRPRPFTIEDVLEDTGVPVDHPNRVGALTVALAKEGVIVPVGYTKARRASRASGVVRVWRGRRDDE